MKEDTSIDFLGLKLAFNEPEGYFATTWSSSSGISIIILFLEFIGSILVRQN
jgi:hypothetical protein